MSASQAERRRFESGHPLKEERNQVQKLAPQLNKSSLKSCGEVFRARQHETHVVGQGSPQKGCAIAFVGYENNGN
jgi:hypothetical protein